MPMTNEEAKAMGDAIFNALQGNGLTGDVASWLTDLAIRVKRLEEKETERRSHETSSDHIGKEQPS